MTTTKTKWIECTASRPCPACGKDSWCSISDDGQFCICRHGTVSDRPHQQKDGHTVYLHCVATLGAPVTPANGVKDSPRKMSAAELKILLKQQGTALSDRKLELEAKRLGVSEQAIKEYRGGWDDRTGLLSIPMFDGDQKCIGFSLRAPSPRQKSCIPGSTNGLFLPAAFDVRKLPDSIMEDASRPPTLLIVTEGGSDPMALFDMGYLCAAFPNAYGGSPLLARLLKRCKDAGVPRDVVVIPHNDEPKWRKDGTGNLEMFKPGWEGALAKCAAIGLYCNTLRCISYRGLKLKSKPKDGEFDEVKDTREMVSEYGAAWSDAFIASKIHSAPLATPEWIKAKREEVELWRGRLKRTA